MIWKDKKNIVFANMLKQKRIAVEITAKILSSPLMKDLPGFKVLGVK